MTLSELETALDSGQLECQWLNGHWHAVRRNGRTRFWKSDPERFAIPCKTGFRDTFTIARDRRDVPSSGHILDSPYLRIRSQSDGRE